MRVVHAPLLALVLVAWTGCTPRGVAPHRADPQVEVAPQVAPRVVDPRTTFALFVGVLEWKDTSLGTFPKANRKDRALEAQLVADGVPTDNIVFLEDRAATKKAILKSLHALAARVPSDGTLIVYYAGHGMRDGEGAAKETYFANYDIDSAHPEANGLSVRELGDVLLHDFKGTRLVLAADCCHSGALADVVRRFEGSKAQAASITSASALDSSTDRWTFTESLVSGFAGDGRLDDDGDRFVSFAELDTYVHAEMRFVEAQRTRGTFTTSFDRKVSLRAVSPSLEPKRIAGPWAIGAYVEVEQKGTWLRARIADENAGSYRVVYLTGPASKPWVTGARLRAPVGLALLPKQAVEVEWEGTWWGARVQQVDEDFALVRYDGYDAAWDEWVPPPRVRAR